MKIVGIVEVVAEKLLCIQSGEPGLQCRSAFADEYLCGCLLNISHDGGVFPGSRAGRQAGRPFGGFVLLFTNDMAWRWKGMFLFFVIGFFYI